MANGTVLTLLFFSLFHIHLNVLGSGMTGQNKTVTRTRNSRTGVLLCSDLGLHDGMSQSFEIYIFSLKYSLFWNIIKNVKQNKIYGLSSFRGVKEIVRKALQFSKKK